MRTSWKDKLIIIVIIRTLLSSSHKYLVVLESGSSSYVHEINEVFH